MDEKTITVLVLSAQRNKATIAQTLYQETQESLAKRKAAIAMAKSAPITTRPNKKERRDQAQFLDIWHG